MDRGTQSEVIEFLLRPDTHGADSASVDSLETHCAVVFFAGQTVYKLKKAVKFSYLDFSTVELRRKACLAEVELNSRTAPQIYRRALPIGRAPDGSLRLGEEEAVEVVDWVVEMARFDQETLFDRLADKGDLDEDLIAGLADRVVEFHGAAQSRPDLGGAEGMAAVIASNDAEYTKHKGSIFDAGMTDSLTSLSRDFLARHTDLLEERRRAGLVRHCHGDMHLRNVCLVEGVPTLFDCIEFDERIACVDVLYDLAFLIMDLCHRDLGHLASVVLNRYLMATVVSDPAQLDGLAILPLFLSCRAGVRAHVSAEMAAASREEGGKSRLVARAQAYLKDATAFLRPPQPRLIAIGGLSGSGKSSLATRLAGKVGPPPGAVLLRSDILRKRLLGRRELDRLGAESYAPEVGEKVYETMRSAAERILRAGYPVVLDAVFAKPAERDEVAQLARGLDVPFGGLWLKAPAEIMAARISGRRNDASDATEQILGQQLKYDIGRVDWTTIQSDDDEEATLERAERNLERDRKDSRLGGR